MLHIIFCLMLAAMAGGFTSFFAVIVAKLHTKVKLLNRKPFNCEPCLAFWLAAVFLVTAIYTPAGLVIVALFAATSIAGTLAIVLTKLLNK